MIAAFEVSCVIVTRGNVDLAEVLDSLPFRDVLIWDNSTIKDFKVYGRYFGALVTNSEVIAVQDDDAIVEDWPAILADYEPGAVVCNMGPGHRSVYDPIGIGLVGFGSVFDRSLIEPTFARYFAKYSEDDLFYRECDRVFTGLNRLKPITVGYRNLVHEETTDRMWREPRHGDDLAEIRRKDQHYQEFTMKLLLAPHNDDEVLWTSFTILRERPVVLVVFDSFVQAQRVKEADAVTQRQETIAALSELWSGYQAKFSRVRFAGLNDDGSYSASAVIDAIKRQVAIEEFDEIFLPAVEEGGHAQHNLVAVSAAHLIVPHRLTTYATYVRGHGKTRTDKPVPIESGEWISRKHRALACYASQINNETLGCRPWFMEDLAEYYA